MTTKRQLLEEEYKSGMTGRELASKIGDVSESYARAFVAEMRRNSNTTAVDELYQEQMNNLALEKEIMEERLIGMLEDALYESGWIRMSSELEYGFTKPAIDAIAEMGTAMRLKNPIAYRGVDATLMYTWAQGFTIQSKNDDVNKALRKLTKHPRNKKTIGTVKGMAKLHRELLETGNIFLIMFPMGSGSMVVRQIPLRQIQDIYTNPEDGTEAWYYLRAWDIVEEGVITETRYTAYPDIDYDPRRKPTNIEAHGRKWPIAWSNPIKHISENESGKWGVCTFYSAIDWALAYKDFLTNLARVWASLARFAWRKKQKGGPKGIAAAKAKLNTSTENLDNYPREPRSGSIWISSEGDDLAPMNTGGMATSASEGRRLFLMAIMAIGFPETFFGDTSTGNLATALSLDRPTFLKILSQQVAFQEAMQEIAAYWLEKEAEKGKIPGVIATKYQEDGRYYIELEFTPEKKGQAAIDGYPKVSFPPIVEDDPQKQVAAVVEGMTLGGKESANLFTDRMIADEVARVLKIADRENLLDQMYDEQGNRRESPTSVTAKTEQQKEPEMEQEKNAQHENDRNGSD